MLVYELRVPIGMGRVRTGLLANLLKFQRMSHGVGILPHTLTTIS